MARSPQSDLKSPPGVEDHVDPMVCSTTNELARLFGQAISGQLHDLGMTIAQLPVALVLSRREGLTQTELARIIGVEQPTMAVTLRRMEHEGFIIRIPDPSDQRQSHVYLTEQARAIEDEVEQLRADVDSIALAGFSERECIQFLRLLLRASKNLQRHLDQESLHE